MFCSFESILQSERQKCLKGLELGTLKCFTAQWTEPSNRTCPVSPARVVVKFTSEMIADPSGGSSGLGLRVVMNNLKFKQTGKKLNKAMLVIQKCFLENSNSSLNN